jgi:hypothetical protein
MTRNAHLVARTYKSGRAFFTVECDTCLAVLNSGHHYDADRDRGHAEKLAEDHNLANHAGGAA